MTFRPPKKFPRFADLKGILTQGKDTDNALYQTIQAIIERLDQLKDTSQDKIEDVTSTTTALLRNTASKFATYHTKEDETSVLPNSIRLLAGSGIIFDDTVLNQRTINLDPLGNHYDSPLTDGDLIAAELIFADGDCIIVQVPL